MSLRCYVYNYIIGMWYVVRNKSYIRYKLYSPNMKPAASNSSINIYIPYKYKNSYLTINRETNIRRETFWRLLFHVNSGNLKRTYTYYNICIFSYILYMYIIFMKYMWNKYKFKILIQ